MAHFLKNLISVVYSLIRFTVRKAFAPSSISFHMVERVSPNVIVSITKGAKIRFGNRVRVHHGSKLSAGGKGILTLGDNVAINQNCAVFSMERIEIGDGTEFGPGVLVYDHDHDFRCKGGLKAGKFKTSPVVIGKNVWIGANSIVTQKRENIIREIIPEAED